MNIKTLILSSLLMIGMLPLASSCSKDETYPTNGETIFRTGKNKNGVVLQDLSKSEKNGSVHGCADCHGQDGQGKYRGGGDQQTFSISYTDLTTSNLYTPNYNDSLIERFIDSETKSNGLHANTGVVFVMSKSDKLDLIEFLKTL